MSKLPTKYNKNNEKLCVLLTRESVGQQLNTSWHLMHTEHTQFKLTGQCRVELMCCIFIASYIL